LQVLWWDTWPTVCHGYDNLMTATMGRDSDCAPRWCELHRISDQVGNHLSNPSSINDNFGKARWEIDLECLLFRFCQSTQAIDYRYHDVTQPVCRPDNRKCPTLDPGKIQKVRDQSFHFTGRTPHFICKFARLLLINLLEGEQQTDREFYICQRIP